jgi:WD40 repeat protein
MTRLMLLGALLLVTAAFAAAPPPPLSPEVRKLIDQLGDDDEDVRNAAAKKLEALGEDVLPALRKASHSLPDVDARLRAGVVAAAIEKKLYGEERVMEGHAWWVFRVVVTPDGKHAISSGDYLRVWDLSTGKEVRRFAPNVYGWGLSLSRDGKRLLAGHGDNTVRLYDLEGKELKKFVKHTDHPWAVALSPDGKKAVTGALDRTMHLWDVDKGEVLLSFDVKDYPRHAVFSPDGKKVVVAHSENTQWNFANNPGTVRVWDAEKGKLLHSGKGHECAITAVAWSKDGKWIASSSFDKTVRIWDAKTLKHVRTIKASNAGCDHVAFTPDSRHVLSTGCGDDHLVRVWEVATGKEVWKFKGHTAHVLCVAVTTDGKYAVTSGSDDHTVRLWPLGRLKR